MPGADDALGATARLPGCRRRRPEQSSPLGDARNVDRLADGDVGVSGKPVEAGHRLDRDPVRGGDRPERLARLDRVGDARLGGGCHGHRGRDRAARERKPPRGVHPISRSSTARVSRMTTNFPARATALAGESRRPLPHAGRRGSAGGELPDGDAARHHSAPCAADPAHPDRADPRGRRTRRGLSLLAEGLVARAGRGGHRHRPHHRRSGGDPDDAHGDGGRDDHAERGRGRARGDRGLGAGRGRAEGGSRATTRINSRGDRAPAGRDG